MKYISKKLQEIGIEENYLTNGYLVERSGWPCTLKHTLFIFFLSRRTNFISTFLKSLTKSDDTAFISHKW